MTLEVTVIDEWKHTNNGIWGVCTFDSGTGNEYAHVTIIGERRPHVPVCIGVNPTTIEPLCDKGGIPVSGMYRIVSVKRN